MTATTPAPGSGRLVIGLIAGIPLTMILAASWLWYFVVNGELDLIGAIGTANHGALLDPPRQVSEAAFTSVDGSVFRWTDGEPRWTMMVVNAGPRCDRDCERRLYTTRQIHIALGREFNRVRRVFVADRPVGGVSIAAPESALPGSEGLTDVDALLPYIEGSQGDMPALTLTPAEFAALFPEVGADARQWYLVDPAGWVMMRFADDTSYKEVIADMKFLLKNSGG